MRPRLLVFILILTLAYACAPSPSTARDSSDDVCIPPLYEVALPIVTPQESNTVTTRQIPPQGNWQIQSALPFPQDKFRSILARPEQNELVLTNQLGEVFIYSIDNEQWKSYPIGDWLETSFLVARDGTIWEAVMPFRGSVKPGKFYPLLRRFNDIAGHFEFVKDISGFLQAPDARVLSNIVEDQSGVLWFFVETKQTQILTSFNVKTKQSQQHYSGGLEGRTNLTIRQDGSVWFSEPLKNQLVRYIPSTQETYIYEYPNLTDTGNLPFNFNEASYIYADHSGRLWIANYGWLEFSENNASEWHRVVESPVFITDRGLPWSQYIMSYQYSTYQSSNDWYWFTGGAGIVRLDLQKGSWCLMTTGISDVAEDNEKNLWIAVFGHLYKYQLKR